MPRKTPPTSTLTSLGLDVGLPLGLYFLLHAGLGVGLVTALALSSIPPAGRELYSVVRERRVNGLAALMLATNVAGIVSSFLTGDPRFVFAKDSLISSVIAIAIIVSVFAGRPLMSEGLQAFMVRGEADRAAAWARLRDRSAGFARDERGYSLVWGIVLLADCAARLVGAVTLPVSTMSWMSTVILVVAIAIASILSGALFANRMQRMLERELQSDRTAGATRPRISGEAMAA